MSFGRFLTSSGVDLARAHNYSSEADQSLGAFFALALVDTATRDAAGNPLRVGGTFNSTVQNATNLVATIKTLCLSDQAYFFGLGQIEGQEADPTVTMEVDTFGVSAGPRSTDTLTGTVVWKLKHAYGARRFLNMLMGGREFDLFMFRNNAVEAAYAGEHGVVYSAFSNASNNRDAKISGGFTCMYKSDAGFLQPLLGIDRSSLFNDVKFTVATPTATLLTPATSNTEALRVYTKALASASSLVFALTPANTAVEWFCTNADGSELPATGKGSFNSITATLTLPSTLAAGRYIYKVFAVNATGIKGETRIEVVVS